MKPQTKGFLITLIATVALANVYIFSKAVLNTVDIGRFGVYWFGFALIWNLSYIFLSGKSRVLKTLAGSKKKIIFAIGMTELIATTFLFLAIDTIDNPSIPSFLSNFGPIFVTLLSFIVLHERFNVIESLGIAIVIVGAFILSYSGKFVFKEIFIDGTWHAIGASLFFAIGTIISKMNIKNIEPIILSLNRAIYLFFVACVYVIITNKGFWIPKEAVFNTLIGSFLGPFLSTLFSYIALKYIEATRVSMIFSTRGIFVLIGAWIYFGSLPLTIQIIGGFITIFGIAVLTLGKRAFERRA